VNGISVRLLHNRAMEHAQDLQILLRRKGTPAAIRRIATRAFWLERCAAQNIPLSADVEPTRSILYRSAACLAIVAERYEDAIECANAGLAGVIHGDIRAELEEALEEALKQKGEVLP